MRRILPLQLASTIFSILVITLASCSGCIKMLAHSRTDPTINDQLLQYLKQKTTILIIPEPEYPFYDDYVELISKAWTLTPIEVVKYKDSGKYFGDPVNYALVQIKKEDYAFTNASYTYYYLALTVGYPPKKKGNAGDQYLLARVELYPNFNDLDIPSNQSVIDYMYKKAELRNFTLPFMFAYLHIMQTNIEKKKTPDRDTKYHNKILMKQLATDTLFVTDNYLHTRNMFNGKEHEVNESIFKGYGGKYKIVTSEELAARIKNRASAHKPLFLFEYVLSNSTKYVGVLDIANGTVVYRTHTYPSYNLKAKDLKDIL